MCVQYILSQYHDKCMLHYLNDLSQQSLEELILPIAQEAVCVQRVFLTIKSQLHHVTFIFYWFLSSKCYLRGRPTKIQGSHCRSVGTEPVPHKTILQREAIRKTELEKRLKGHCPH